MLHVRASRLILAVLVCAWSLSAPVRAAEQIPAPVLGKTGDNLASGGNQWDLGAADVTYKEARKEIWVLDSFSDMIPSIKAFNAEDPSTQPRTIPITLPAEFQAAPVLGLGEIPHGDFRGKNLILIDPNFGVEAPPGPLLGIFDDDGRLDPAAPFVPVIGIAETAVLTAIDVNPESERIVAYDVENHTAYILDFGFTVELGPIDLLGGNHLFWGPWFLGSSNRQGLRGSAGGIAFNGSDRILALETFTNAFTANLVLEYDIADGGYTGQAIDLSAAAAATARLDLEFAGVDTGRMGDQDALFALNMANESVFVFQELLQPHPAPVTLTGCGVIEGTGQYSLTWGAVPAGEADSFVIFENGVEVATLPPAAISFLSPGPLLGKGFIEVGTLKGGFVGGPRTVCQVENTTFPRLEGVENGAVEISNLGGVLGIAVTKKPANTAAFRAYLVGFDTNNVLVLDHNLMGIETIQLNPQVVTQGTNLAALGLALIEGDGDDQIVILDSDGPLDNNIPSASFFPVEGAGKGTRVREVNPVDLTALTPRPFLYDWDVDASGDFIAGGVIPGPILGQDEYVLVRLDADEAGIRATAMVPFPQRGLTPFATLPGSGLGVSVLPSGNLFIAGSDTFSRTYTEALLATPFTDNAATSAKIVGYAQGLITFNQLVGGLGPHLGPDQVFGLEAAFFPPEGARTEGIGVSYLTGNDIVVITNPSGGGIAFGLSVIVQSENEVANPDLVAEQLAETVLDIAAGAEASTGTLRPGFTPQGTIDYFYHVINQSTTAAATAEVKLELDGGEVAAAAITADLPAGRYVRRSAAGRSERSMQVRVKNTGTSPASFKVIAGAMAAGTGGGADLFRRGDCDGLGANPALTDAIFGLNYLFQSGPVPPCVDACDADDNGQANLTDMIFILNYLFLSGRVPPAPGPFTCGPDPTTDDPFTDCAYPQDACGA